ncbi:uncharacterized protein N7506_001774 [Penicillium brevicompactum]|uniref:uncharacterized protein n=1 Tax=Penicillium brevicompactum TaxID=5074 RepID=UPI0025401E09|nr:uncharacterized protein N7506_001774 [Penicillium brevicompactum]KAJ5348521.1 hypothetical protein N7506_001774 [Penicillium brevicompactum]
MRVNHFLGNTLEIGKPEVGFVQKRDGKCLEAGVPEYVAKPTSYGYHSWDLAQEVKIIDFGESFLHTAPPETLHTPLSLRAPEVRFKGHIDYRVDLRSIGCMGTSWPQKAPAQLAGMAGRVYFDGPLNPDFTREDIVRLAQIVGRLLNFEPSARASARQVLGDPWFNE